MLEQNGVPILKPTGVLDEETYIVHLAGEALPKADVRRSGSAASATATRREASTAEAEALGVRRVVLRTGVVLAREGGALPRMALPFRLMAGAPLGNGRQWLPWIHMADEVGTIRFLLEHDDAHGPFNLVAPNPVTNRQLGDGLARVLRRPSPLQALGLGVPEPVFRLLLGEMADAVLHSQRALPSRLLQLGYLYRFPDVDSALRDLFED